jgi:hypothetical protein
MIFGAKRDAILSPRPDSAAIAILSEKESDTILAATFMIRKITLNLMRFATVGTIPPTRKITAEYVIIKKNVSITAWRPHPIGFSLHQLVVLFRKLF